MSLDQIQKLEAEIERLQKIAYFDDLTGLFNRKALCDRLSQEWDRAIRHQFSIALLFLDLNNLKHINDNHGHDQGDRYIQSFARVLQKQNLRSYDFVARYAGDEFIIVLPDSSIHGARRVADKIYEDSMIHECSVAIGCAACVPPIGSKYQQLINAADKNMYDQKNIIKTQSVAVLIGEKDATEA